MNMNTLRNPRLILPAAVLAATALAGCSESSPGTPTVEPSAASHDTNATASSGRLMLRFNDLGGGSSIVQVYPGTSSSEADMVYSGTYRNGDERPVACHTEGRKVTSHPEVGEDRRESTDWYKLAGGTVVQFASGTYADVLPQGTPVTEC